MSKRLTDVELSAEYWRARWAAQDRATDLESCHSGASPRVMDRIFAKLQQEQRRASTLHRFATHPHHDEES